MEKLAHRTGNTLDPAPSADIEYTAKRHPIEKILSMNAELKKEIENEVKVIEENKNSYENE